MQETKKALLTKDIPEAEADLLAHLSDGSLGQALRFREERIMDFRNAALKFVAEFPMQAPMTYLLNEDYFSDLEEILIEADVGVNVTLQTVDELLEKAKKNKNPN